MVVAVVLKVMGSWVKKAIGGGVSVVVDVVKVMGRCGAGLARVGPSMRFGVHV